MISLLSTIIDVFLHLDQYLATIIAEFGIFTYAILFFIIFLETGLVVTPFLPGDSLLFATGTFAALGSLAYWPAIAVCLTAAILGDTVNYWIGHHIGPLLFSGQRIRWLNLDHLHATEQFYAKHGNITIILARFVPIVRTFAPFVAGIANMRYRTFFLFNVIGGCLWVFLFVTAGYYFGTLPTVQERFHFVILGIIVVSLIPSIVRGAHVLYHKRKRVKPPPESES